MQTFWTITEYTIVSLLENIKEHTVQIYTSENSTRIVKVSVLSDNDKNDYNNDNKK